MSHTAPTLPLRPFFDLPYNVRAVIYEQFETDALRPLSKGTEYAGFALSCSQAKDEVEYVAVQRYTKFLDEFKKTFEQETGRAVQVLKPIAPKTLSQMRKLTIQLPIDPPGYTIALGVDQNMLGALRLLFSCFSDKLRLHFHAPNIPQRPSLTDDLRDVLGDIADTIEHVNSPCAFLSSVHTIKRVDCKAIVVCWDSRTTGKDKEEADDTSIEFKGKFCGASVSYGIGYLPESRRWWSLENKSRSLVEMGISNSLRWAEPCYDEITDMLYPEKTWGVTRMGFEGELVKNGQVYAEEEEDE